MKATFSQISCINDIILSQGSVSILREDLLHPTISGNKYRKLKHNLLEAKKLKFNKILTFGGAFSNHIAATAAAGKEFGFQTIGIIRGDELENNTTLNPTLKFAQNCGMTLHYVSRAVYRHKDSDEFYRELEQKYGSFYVLPEGGTNKLAIKGCEEILGKHTEDYDIICVSVGTGGTLAGIVNTALSHQRVIGFSALKGRFQQQSIAPYIDKNRDFELIDQYCFGGYGKIDSELVRFINEFYKNTGIPLDPVYTGKMMFGISHLIRSGEWNENKCILAIHTGGLQGVAGMNLKLEKKNLPQINSCYVD